MTMETFLRDLIETFLENSQKVKKVRLAPSTCLTMQNPSVSVVSRERDRLPLFLHVLITAMKHNRSQHRNSQHVAHN